MQRVRALVDRESSAFAARIELLFQSREKFRAE
jgi:hypothetical protein